MLHRLSVAPFLTTCYLLPESVVRHDKLNLNLKFKLNLKL